MPPKLLGTGIRKKPRTALAFVAVWTLLGIKLISGHAKNVVALNANAMNVGLWRRRGSAGQPLRTCDRSIGGFGHKRHSNMGGREGGIPGEISSITKDRCRTEACGEIG
jgi:hypothetical protein